MKIVQTIQVQEKNKRRCLADPAIAISPEQPGGAGDPGAEPRAANKCPNDILS